MGKRRAHGEGGLFVRNKDTDRERWVGRLTLPDGTRKDVYGKTQTEARRKLNELKEAAAKGLAVTTGRQTVGQFLEDWLEHTARPTLRPRTFAGYRTIVRVYLVPRLGRIKLAELTPQQVQAFQNELLRASRADGRAMLSSGTVVNARRVLSKALEQATRWGLIARNPVKLVDGPKVTRKEIEPLDPEQARVLLAAIRGDRLVGHAAIG